MGSNSNWRRCRTNSAESEGLFSIQHLVGDKGARTLLFDLDQAIQGITASQGRDNPNLLKLTGVYHNLVRGWAMP